MEESILMWNRLEGSLRNENQLENALSFEIRDALWMLTRQWQFGEFEGEDAGTAAFVRITGQQAAVTGSGPSTRPVQPFDYMQTPLELPLERELFIPDLADRLEMGRHWERLLVKRLPPAMANEIVQQFKSISLFRFAMQLPKAPDPATLFQNAQKYSDEAWLLLNESLSASGAIDGYMLLKELRSGKAASVFLPQANEIVNATGVEYMNWFERVYGQNTTKGNTWHDRHLEYQPQIAFNNNNGQPLVLRKEEYYGEGIDWHGFTAIPNWDGQSPPALPLIHPVESSATAIPSGVRFRGMPSNRLWEMEDSQVDFGSIRASSTELGKMLFAEFGLVYGNDWLIAPVRFQAGNMCRVTKLMVTDIFGKESILEEIPTNQNWAFFQTVTAEIGRRWLFLANGTDFIQESKPIEKVAFLRDEMSNLVWGVEEIIASPYGGGRDAESLAKRTTQLARSLQPPAVQDTEGKPSSAGWNYKAGTLMAENRIPFIPMAVDATQSMFSEKRKIMLQRAATPRVSDAFPPIRIRPRTMLLGNNGKAETEKPDPLFIFEEEIPRTGIALNLVWKRARWFNGQTYTWLARKKTVGRGEVDGNFRFDQLRK